MNQLLAASWPEYCEDEIEAVSRVLRSGKVNYWTGDECREFEREFADYCESEFAVAVANGTVALELALIALGLGKGDEVVVTPRSFIASASTVAMSGAIPVFADVDANSQNITAESISAVLTSRTRAIVIVHLSGWPCEMDPIMKLAEQNGLFVIEDCAQAHGARYRGQSVGSFGNVGCWSFCQDKIITTGGEGGMVTTNDRELWNAMWSYKDHGKSWQSVYEKQHPPGFRWLHDSFGTNWRMTEMQAAIGRIQLRKLDGWVARREANSSLIESACKDILAFRVPSIPDYLVNARYRCNLFVEPDKLGKGWSRDNIVSEINRRGVPCFQGICPEIYLEKAFDESQSRPESRLPVARQLGETSLAFLVHPNLDEESMLKAAKIISEVGLEAAGA